MDNSDRQGSCFVTADDLRTAQGLDCRQPPHEGLATCHALYTEGESDGHDGWEAFGNSRYSQADGAQEELKRCHGTQQT